MSAPVFISPEAADAVAGGLITVTGGEARHAVTVQRREVGERIDVVDGHGVRAAGVIEATGPELCAVRVSTVSTDSDPAVTLVQALAKGGRDEQAVEAAIELGATRIIPWQSERSIVQWRGPKAEKARAKWESLVTAATKQSRRAFLAPVDQVVSTSELVSNIGRAVESGARVLVLHEEADVALTDLDFGESMAEVWVVVGPEGGISEREVDLMAAAGGETVALGPHVLRASSAGPVAIAALAATRGTWSRGATAHTSDARGLR
ncbi:16S rRNA (uracil(1498)-N(3))-methyltransferase [Demequina sediminicola]|uniref:16S rRNA (uracil(1498)-N(3))-methyltransferase n=1 Tax=Demequina sediminicola TaxID=1095026 RepID=UPI000783D85F|nr:16S rRNA (uracil(1498)-N(3))-methyltransferase [Demequina sediminicola]